MEAIIAQLVGGAIGGNGAGKLLSSASMGNLGNTIAGAVGGLAGGTALGGLMGGAGALWQLGQLTRLRLAWTSAEL